MNDDSGLMQVLERQTLFQTTHGDLSLAVYQDINGIASEWDTLGAQNIFLSSRYLRSLEVAPADGMSFMYLLVKAGTEVVGIVYLQHKEFVAAESLNYDRNADTEKKWSKTVSKAFREYVAQKINFTAVVCGNAIVTGEHGFLFAEHIEQREQLLIVDYSVDWVRNELKRRGTNTSMVFMKDFFEDVFSEKIEKNYCSTYHPLGIVEPNMIMALNPEWDSYDDYLAALLSKYRVRAKRARKLLGEVRRREIHLEEVGSLQEKMYDLYGNIANRASFNLIRLHPDYFRAVKENLGDDFRIYAYELDGEMVAFYTLMHNHAELEAHFIGYDYALNRKGQLYLNMLLDMVGMGIEKRFERIIFARTALEIKSSVGAVPHEMHCYLQHQEGIKISLMPYFFQFLSPVKEWVQRRPFKAVREET